MTKQTMVKVKENTTVKKANILDKTAIKQKCRHFWLIEAAAGPISRGICQLCGTKRNFDNYLTDCLKANREQI